MKTEEFLWVEKYRPKQVKDTILPATLKATFQQFVDDKSIPNLMLVGLAGVGKTTIARAMLDEIGADYIIINGSLSGNIETLRNDIKSFASTISFAGGRKYVILDEADYLNANSTQPALRNFMEEYSKNCGFILTCNYPARIIKELHSRCSVITFTIPKVDRPRLAMEFLTRLKAILVKEKVEFDKEVLVPLIQKFFPDYRRIVNELQRYAATGKIDSGILTNLDQDSIKNLLGFMAKKEFSNVRKWAAENSDIDFTSLSRRLFDTSTSIVGQSSIPQLILLLAKYQYQSSFVADQEINTVAALAEIMVECEFK